MQFSRIMVHTVVKLGSTVTPSTNVFYEVLVLCKALLPPAWPQEAEEAVQLSSFRHDHPYFGKILAWK